MLEREVVFKFTWSGVAKVVLFSPLVVLPCILLLYLPWGSPNAPAWVQAVGSIAAILATWLIPYQHEKLRIRKQRRNLIASLGWLALRVKNNFDHMESVVRESECKARDGWLFVSAPNDWAIHRDAAREFPLMGFTRDEISWLLALRSVTEFGCLCADTLRLWDFDSNPNLARDFPYNDGMVFHRSQIDWVFEELSFCYERGDIA